MYVWITVRTALVMLLWSKMNIKRDVHCTVYYRDTVQCGASEMNMVILIEINDGS